MSKPLQARIGRIPVTNVSPVVDGGRFPAKAVPGEDVPVGATAFREGHDAVGATAVLYAPDGREAARARMEPGPAGTDTWRTLVRPDAEGEWEFEVEAWDDPYGTWLHNAHVKIDAGVDTELMLAEGARLLSDGAGALEAAARELAGRGNGTAPGGFAPFAPVPGDSGDRRLAGAAALRQAAAALRDTGQEVPARLSAGSSPGVRRTLADYPLRRWVTRSGRFPLLVEREGAGRGAWYEFFPRSEGAAYDPESGTFRSGTFATAAERLPAVAEMGFDVIYLPPIHPIGHAHRKGPNNTLVAGPNDPGSPWAIGSAEGGHDAIHPDLGTEEDFAAFVARARDVGLEVALDLALQASPDHPWVREHPQWFTTRVDGSIAYAENPPKKYQDIYPLNFDNDPEGLSAEVLRIVLLWIDRGVRIFRVDNPHTKPLWFWQWLIAQVESRRPGTVFLAEAFTRPAMMQALAKAGFQQSYTYFTWRNTKSELEEYLTEVSRETGAYFRPNFFVNTPDILTEYLQFGGPAAFRIRAVLAAMAAPLWGVYAGYELFEHVARPGAEEYIDNEKYEYKTRDFAAAEAEGRSLAPYLRRLNEIRRTHPALGDLRNLVVHRTTDDATVAFSKTKEYDDGGARRLDTVIVVVNTDPHGAREGEVELDLDALRLRPEDLDEEGRFTVDDLLTGQSWRWGERNYVRLDPHAEPAHILHVRRP